LRAITPQILCTQLVADQGIIKTLLPQPLLSTHFSPASITSYSTQQLLYIIQHTSWVLTSMGVQDCIWILRTCLRFHTCFQNTIWM